MPWLGPIGQLTWNLSLGLAEWWQLRRQPWWSPLRRGLRQEFADLDPDRLVRRLRGDDVGSLAYGETSPLSVLKVLESVKLPPASRVVDVGSGRGVPCLVAAALGYPSVGLEYFAVYTERSQRIAEQQNWPATFKAGSFLHSPLPPAALYMVSASAFPEEVRGQLFPLLLDTPNDSWVVTQDWVLNPPFQLTRMQQLPVSWGVAKFCYHVRPPRGASD